MWKGATPRLQLAASARCRLPSHSSWILLYDRIYQQASEVPGYARYAAYAERVLHCPDPLGELANSEEMYWAVRRVLVGRRLPPKARVLDVGSGFGYLTYALNRAGYECTGVDISSEAVEAASDRYGPYYVCADIRSFAKDSPRTYDVLVATEVVEHLPDAPRLVPVLLSMVRSGGCLIVTTPNRSLYEDDVLWETEPPPVHLWWFSEASFQMLAQRLSCTVDLVDFSDYYQGRIVTVRRPPPGGVASRVARMGADRSVLRHGSAIRRLVKRTAATLGMAGLVQIVRLMNRRRWIRLGSRGTCMCAVFQTNEGRGS